nr:immunoglobulin heavy chain junction region [Macaca mulatta]MPN69311.1 immunoglobulin heavy chain junction region [Macaca mulatta]MPN69537.1 immunoglobulin heavy chain junction region [Macaca mulatta]MPN69593.1 immunoglobulin heavy chain junction region [Macaca mulatta]MPN69935.1 immunoglobulin heavy chain junction region [Macaca mulatta]
CARRVIPYYFDYW